MMGDSVIRKNICEWSLRIYIIYSYTYIIHRLYILYICRVFLLSWVGKAIINGRTKIVSNLISFETNPSLGAI